MELRKNKEEQKTEMPKNERRKKWRVELLNERRRKEEKSKDTEKKTRFRVNCGDLVGLRDGHLTMDN